MGSLPDLMVGMACAFAGVSAGIGGTATTVVVSLLETRDWGR